MQEREYIFKTKDLQIFIIEVFSGTVWQAFFNIIWSDFIKLLSKWLNYANFHISNWKADVL